MVPSGIPNSLAALAPPISLASFTACTLYSWSYLRATLNTSLFSWFYYEILENKLSTFFILHHRHTKYDLPKHQRIIFLFVVEMVSSDLGLSLRQYSFHPYIESFVSTLSRSLEDLLTCAFNDVLLFPLCFHSRLVIDDRLCFTT